MILWVDDTRNPVMNGFIGAYWATNYDQAIAALETREVTFASLDHDIGACQDCIDKLLHIGDMLTPETTFFNRCSHEKTGYDIMKYIEEHNCFPINGIRVHSMNPVGRASMEQVIQKHYGRLF